MTDEKEFDEMTNSEEEADLTAASDSISSDGEELPKIEYKVTFKKPYTFGDETVKELDLSRLYDLTTIDAQEVDRVMNRLNHTIRGSKFADTLYVKHIAMRATGYSADFFNQLKWSDMEEIKSKIMLFFMLN